MQKSLLEELTQKLITEKEILEKELASFAQKDTNPTEDWDTKYPDMHSGGHNSMEDEADEVTEYETKLPIEHNLELKLKDVSLALEKIKEGRYGICEGCGKEIDIERLKVMPEAKFCLKCQQ